MDFWLLGLQQLADPWVFLTMCIGAILGVIVGAIPGAGAAVTISILLPTTFSMDPLTGMTLLLGVYCGSAYGSAIPAVMINTPGSPVAVLTALEAKPFVDRGEARRALSLAYSSSFVGGVLAVLALMALTLPLAKVARNFGSAEFAMLALAALVLVVVGHTGRRVEAAAAMAFGLFLATIGIETAYSTQRYSFGFSFLSGGIPLVPMVIGLFAISEALVQLTARDVTRPVVQLGGRFFQGFAEVFRYKVTLFGSSIFGILCGIMPGVGEFLGQQVNYVWARKLSKEGHLFGKGAPEGIIVSEATNNSVPPAALIPMLALGIPGEELTAMMLAVFLVHNVIPGPDLFVNRPEFVSGLYWTLLAMNFVIIVFLLFATNAIARAAQMNKRFPGRGNPDPVADRHLCLGLPLLGRWPGHGLRPARLCPAQPPLAADAHPAGSGDGADPGKPDAAGPGWCQWRPDDLRHPADFRHHGRRHRGASVLHHPRLDQGPQTARGLADQ